MRAAVAILTAAVSTAALTVGAEAQRRVSGSSNGARGHFMVGIEQLDLDQLNVTLGASGYPTFSDNFLTLGGGGFAIRNRLVIGGEGHALIQSTETSAGGSLRTGLTGGYGLVDVGYLAVRGRRFSVYPMIGIGGGGLMLDIQERNAVEFDEILDDPGRGASVTNAGLVLGASLGADLLIPTDARASRGISIGFRAGYNFMPLASDWRLNGFDVAGGPESLLDGPFVRLSIGGGHR